MFCHTCGKELTDGVSFCPQCGSALGTAPAAARGRLAVHFQLLGILWLALGAFRLIPALVMIAVFATPLMPPEMPMFARGMMPVLGGLFLVAGVLSIVTGGGLLARQSWGRMLAIVFGGLNLIDIPFGTALGIYTLWVMLPEESEKEYQTIIARGG